MESEAGQLREYFANSNLGKLLLEESPAAVAVFDTEMRYLACSRRWISDYRLGDRDIISRSHFEIFPEINERMRDVHRRALAGETLSSEAEPFERGDGVVDWIKWAISPWHTSDGEIGGVVLFTEVLTQAIEMQRAARSLHLELDQLIDSATNHAICLLDPAGQVLIWNAGAQRLYGWSEDEIIGKSYAMMFAPDDRAAGLPHQQIDAARRDGAFHGRTLRMRKDGTCFLAKVSINRIDDAAGVVTGFGQVVQDITEEAEHARATEEHSAFLRSMLDTVPDAMITIDEHGLVQSFSAAAEALFGYAADEVVGRNVAMLMPEPDASRHDSYLARYHSTGERRVIGFSRRVLGRRKDGSIFPHVLQVGEAHGGGKRIFTGFLRDLTAQEQAEAQMRELQSELIHIARVSAVGTMATALAHELNQPLMAIANYVQSSAAMLASRQEEELQLVRSALADAGAEALRAGDIVHRLREFVARGELERTIVPPREIAIHACELGALGSGSSNITCDIRVPPELKPVFVDRVHIQQVLLNLIRNSCEALGESGSIVINASEDGRMAHFSVVDDGPGFAPGKAETLFEPFVSDKANGMGIGLAICRTIIEAHGGRMWGEPAPGGGAAFHFTVPIAEFDDV